MTRLRASASNIANASSTQPEPYRPVRTAQGDLPGGGTTARIELSGAPQVDLSDEMVEGLVAKIAFQANAKMLETAHALEQRVIDRLA